MSNQSSRSSLTETSPKKEFKYHLFDVLGLELEYMIVDKETLNVKAVADKVLVDDNGNLQDDLEFEGDNIGWSNELATHVLEFKVNKPVPSTKGAANDFFKHIRIANKRLEKLGAILMPGAMHPFMNPDKDFVVWPHGSKEIYNKYNEIFECKGHGWSNLQSAHINFPFKNDAEFKKLHAALRVMIVLTSALSASSPYMEGKFTGILDNRMHVYKDNARKIPLMAGLVVPDAISSRQEYEEKILEPLYNQLEPHDPEGILRDEWANSRGCIARFDRGAIELRTISTQECPKADMAIVSLITAVVKSLCEEKWVSIDTLNAIPTESLHTILLEVIKTAENTVVSDTDFLAAFGITEKSVSAQEMWRHLYAAVQPQIESEHTEALEHILTHGTLSSRLLKKYGTSATQDDFHALAKDLISCLDTNTLFLK